MPRGQPTHVAAGLWRLISAQDKHVSHLVLVFSVEMWSLDQTDNETQMEIAQSDTFMTLSCHTFTCVYSNI